MEPLKLAVIASGRGSNLQAILDAIRDGSVQAEVKLVLSDKAEAFALKRAADHGIPGHFVNPKDYETREAFEEAMLEIIRPYQCQCVVLAGFMRILTPHFVGEAGLPILNIHPALLPSFQGLNAQRQALEYGVRYSGCTVHFVDEGVDTGPIIKQAVVPVYPEDDEEALTQRILEEEHKIYPQVIGLMAEGRIKRQGRKVIILGEGGQIE